jgi:hypothetical protein
MLLRLSNQEGLDGQDMLLEWESIHKGLGKKSEGNGLLGKY